MPLGGAARWDGEIADPGVGGRHDAGETISSLLDRTVVDGAAISSVRAELSEGIFAARLVDADLAADDLSASDDAYREL
jgi:hypothetical protein